MAEKLTLTKEAALEVLGFYAYAPLITYNAKKELRINYLQSDAECRLLDACLKALGSSSDVMNGPEGYMKVNNAEDIAIQLKKAGINFSGSAGIPASRLKE